MEIYHLGDFFDKVAALPTVCTCDLMNSSCYLNVISFGSCILMEFHLKDQYEMHGAQIFCSDDFLCPQLRRS